MKILKRVLISCVFGTLLLAGIGSKLFAQEEKKIPRRVFFAPPPAGVPGNLQPEEKSLLENIPYFLFSAVTSLEPIVLVDKGEQANSSISTEFAEKEGTVEISFTLKEKEPPQKQERIPFRPGETSLADLSGHVRRVAESFAPFLTEVAPEVSIERKMQEERQNKIVREASFTDSLATPFQLTLWSGGFLQYVTAKLPGESYITETKSPYLTRFALDLGWYRTPNFGFLASLYVDYNDHMYFGSNDMPTDTDKDVLSFTKTENLFTLAGIGVSYRTLGRIAGEFNVLWYLGTVQVTAKEDMYYLYKTSDGEADFDRVLDLMKGDKAVFFFTFLSFQPCLALNFSEKFSLKARISMNIDPRIIGNSNLYLHPYNRYSNFLFMYLGELGAAVRF